MAFTSSAVWDLQASGSDSNGGGFDTGVAGFPTDGAATSATGNSPVFSSASYTFVAGDVGAWVYIKSGTNWTPGWYQIASVSGGNATLSAAIGAATLAYGELNTAAGCATTASPTAATWGLDYSKGTSAQIAFTDMVIDGTTNTKFTSAGNPVGKNFVGNVINVTSGTGFTVQRVAIVSTSGTTATCDKSLGTLSSTGGHGSLGGALLTVSKVQTLIVSGNNIYQGAGTYTLGSAVTFGSVNFLWMGWNSVRGDRTTTRPLITTSALTTFMLLMQISATVTFRGVAFTSTNGTPGQCFLANSGSPVIHLDNCTMSGFSYGVYGASGTILRASNCKFSSMGTDCLFTIGSVILNDCYFNAGSNTHIQQCTHVSIHSCIFDTNSSNPAIWQPTDGVIKNCSFYNIDGGSYAVIYIAGSGLNELLVENCIIWGDGSHVGLQAGTQGSLVSRNNAIGNVATRYIGVLAGSGDVQLTSNPFTNAGSGDFSLNSTSGGGAACKAVGAPGTFIGAASTTCTPDLGAVPKTSAGGGSTGGGSFGFVA